MVKKVIREIFIAIDTMLAAFGAMLVVGGILLALTGHLDINITQGMRSAGACFQFIK